MGEISLNEFIVSEIKKMAMNANDQRIEIQNCLSQIEDKIQQQNNTITRLLSYANMLDKPVEF